MGRVTLLEFRRGTASAWSSANPVLAAGEPGWESDTNKLKIGDGSTAWNSLGYFSAAATSPLTTKGDLYGHSSVDARIPVGSDSQVLIADSAQTLGLKWGSTTVLPASMQILDTGNFTGGTVSVTHSSSATADTICSTAGHTYDGSTNIIVEAFIFAADTNGSAASQISFNIFEDSTDLGVYGIQRSPAAGVLRITTMMATEKRTPSAASHTYTLKAWMSNGGGTGVVYGGAGGAGTNTASWIRVIQVA